MAHQPALLTLNAGSSSIKFALFPIAQTIAFVPALNGEIEGIAAAGSAHLRISDSSGQRLADTTVATDSDHLAGATPHQIALAAVFDWLREHAANWDIRAVGHRVVHGGTQFFDSAVLSASTLEALEKLVPLAPLHQPHNLAGIRAVSAILPDVPQVACFDTAFHRTQPELAQTFGLPRALSDSGVKRYGFHGLSYDYIAEALGRALPAPLANGRVIVAHLGNGSSLCAMRERRSMATSMGFSALDGVMMGTRCGAIDPGVLLYLMQTHNYDAKALEKLLYRESGLLGVSGVSADMRDLLGSEHPHAAEAIELFCYNLRRQIGALAAAIDGLDALIFTGGIGTYSPAIRAKTLASMSWLGLELDSARNAEPPHPIDPATGLRAWPISSDSSPAAIWVIPTNEEWVIARHTAARLQA
jgi:acetate kinase